MYKVKKTFSAAYGHRLLNYKGKCENLHGHNGKIEIIIKSEKLDSENMVIDFTVISEKLKNWLNQTLDHKIILSKKDPLLKLLRAEGQLCYETEENPTAEALAKVIFEKAKEIFPGTCKINFWETDSSCAVYGED